MRCCNGEEFPAFLDDVLARDVRRQEKVTVLSLQSGMGGADDFATQPATIYMFDTNTTLCRAQYYAEVGLSGSGVITEIEADGKVKVIGVHTFYRMIRQSQVSQLREHLKRAKQQILKVFLQTAIRWREISMGTLHIV